MHRNNHAVATLTKDREGERKKRSDCEKGTERQARYQTSSRGRDTTLFLALDAANRDASCRGPND